MPIPIAKNVPRETRRKYLALAIVLILLGTGLWAIFAGVQEEKKYETGAASLADITHITSSRKASGLAIAVSSDTPFYPIISTPAAVYYSSKGERSAVPLVVADRYSPSDSVVSFLSMYGNPGLASVGNADNQRGYIGGSIVQARIGGGTIKDESMQLAMYFWNRTEGAIIVKNDIDGYNLAVGLAASASYLNIPIIVSDGMDSSTASFLSSMGVKYTIAVGEIKGYGATMHIKTVLEAQTFVLDVIKGRLNSSAKYIAVANPADTYAPEVLESMNYAFSGSISDSSAPAYPGAAPVGSDGPSHNFNIPAGYEYARLKIDLRMDVSGARGALGFGNDADASGERIYAFLGIDGNKDAKLDASTPEDKIQFFGGSPAYDYIREEGGRPLYAWFYTELPYFRDTGAHTVQLLASLPTVYPSFSSTYTLDITVEKLVSPTYPLVPGISSMAPYLAAYRGGVVMADDDYGVHESGYLDCKACGVPAANPDVLAKANNRTLYVKSDLNALLGTISGVKLSKENDTTALASYFSKLALDKRPYVGIIADTNMVPQYYFKTGQGGGEEGYGMPSDNVYIDIDLDAANAPKDVGGKDPTFELPAGRILGWDAQDVSALLARTFFYDKIIDSHEGPDNNGIVSDSWKNSAMTTVGTEPPVGAARTAADKLNAMWSRAGLDVDSIHNGERSRRQLSQDTYESSNFIYFCAHGFYYWYVPTAWEGTLGILPATYGGGGYDVSHVKTLSMGPSVIYGSSCVTGRTDGLDPRNALSLAYIHAGVNTYVGATRSSWGALFPVPNMKEGESLGDLLALYFFGNMAGYTYNKEGGLTKGSGLSDLTVGLALMEAKNLYVQNEGTDNGGENDDTFNEFIIYGDPAFNPYEPINEGSA